MEPRIRVWDLPVRVFHWLLVASMGAAWATAGHAAWLEVHLAAGWLAAGLVLFRVAWAFVGRGHARLGELAWPARAVGAHARALVRGEPPRYLGHNPVAGWVMLVGLAAVLTLGATGALVLGGEEGRGPLAARVGVGSGIAWHAVHTWLAWGIVAWVALHLAGIAKESLRTRENLPAAMVTGRKRGEGVDAAARIGVGMALLLGSVGVVAAQMAAPPTSAPALPQDATWRAACGDCHLAFHPGLLPARSWTRMLDAQADHFGEDLMLDAPQREALLGFVDAASADRRQNETAWRIAETVPGEDAPQRITELPWWGEVHADVPAAAWVAAGAKLRCEACHRDAATGAFEGAAILEPGGE